SDRGGAYRVSPNGTHVAYGADEGGDERWVVWVMRADGSEARPLTNRRDRIHHVVDWTPDSRAVLAFANLRDERYFDLHEIPLDGSTPRLLFRHDGTGFRATALPDGRVVVTTNRSRSDENHLTLLERDGSARRLTPDSPAAMHVEAHAYDGGGLLLSDRGGCPKRSWCRGVRSTSGRSRDSCCDRAVLGAGRDRPSSRCTAAPKARPVRSGTHSPLRSSRRASTCCSRTSAARRATAAH